MKPAQGIIVDAPIGEMDHQILNLLFANSVSFSHHANSAVHKHDGQAEVERKRKD